MCADFYGDRVGNRGSPRPDAAPGDLCVQYCLFVYLSPDAVPERLASEGVPITLALS